MYKRIIILILIFTVSIPTFSVGEGAVETAGQGPVEQIPLTRVTLYTAGLAQMVHETKVRDNEVLTLAVDPGDINDILKSLTLEDLDGGSVEVVNFDSDNPLSVSLGDLRMNPSGAPSLADFLQRAQGERVRITADGTEYSGRIFSVETYQKDEHPHMQLNLLTAEGLKAVDLAGGENILFEDPALQEELTRALNLIAGSRVKSVRHLRILFQGTGERRVRISYIREVPLWKTSYRAVLDEEGKARLEGWALVQNTGSRPWRNVRLSFVAGQPNAFKMDLATPRYVPRQEVETASSAPIGPTSYEKGYSPEAAPSARSKAAGAAPRMALNDELSMAEAEEPYSPVPVQPRAAGTRSGNFYRYEVASPVSVDARSSAMIPIIQTSDAGETLGVYDPAYGLVFKGLRLSNATDAHWAAGPVTVMEGRFYGGDALLPEMIPGSSRLITYAVHGTLDVQKDSSVEPQRITALKISSGVLYRTDKIVRETSYRIEGKEHELVLIHPREAGWKLTESPPVAEQTPSEYRFSLKEWDSPVRVSEERIISRQFNLGGFRISDLAFYLDWKEISPSMKQALQRIADLKQNVESIRSDVDSMNASIGRYERDQNRIRENMKVLDKESDLFKQYAARLADQEKQIENLNAQVDRRQNDLSDAEDALKEYISGLDVE